VAVGLLDGRVGLLQFSDDRATSPDAAALRAITELVPTDDCARDAATVVVRLTGGNEVSAHVSHARGSLSRPLTDGELMAKVDALTEPVLGASSAATILAAVDGIAAPTGFADVLAAARPHNGSVA
jgi:2-methylcitrate dehydratase PrpD